VRNYQFGAAVSLLKRKLLHGSLPLHNQTPITAKKGLTILPGLRKMKVISAEVKVTAMIGLKIIIW
jgi:hypothetical protein